MANDLLLREGLIERRHGQGTFVAEPAEENGGRTRRLGLLLLSEGRDSSSAPLMNLSMVMAEQTRRRGYELVVERIELESLMLGEVPRMIQQRSVDGFFTFGWYFDHHFRYLDRQGLPYMQLGNRPISASVPQATFDFERLTYDLTGALYQAGRRTIWLDADPGERDYSVKIDMLRGYQRAVREHDAGDGGLHLCPLEIDALGDVVQRLSRTDPAASAFIVEDWSMAMLPAMLRACLPRAGELLIVPMPNQSRYDMMRDQGPNVALWDRTISMNDLVEPAMAELISVMEGRRAMPRSIEVKLRCSLIEAAPRARVRLGLEVQTVVHEAAQMVGAAAAAADGMEINNPVR
jgi:hypothetical protein